MKNIILSHLALVLMAAAWLPNAAHASPRNVEVDSLNPANRDDLNSFCNFHPSSGLCFFTPNPVPKPPLTPPSSPTQGPITGIPAGPITPWPVDGQLVQGAFMGENNIYNILHASKASLFIDSGNPISKSSTVRSWVQKGGGQAMRVPRPGNVKLALAGWVPLLSGFSYNQAANNDPRWRAEFEKIGEILQSSGYGDTIIYSAETEKAWKKWHPKASDMAGGENSNWKRAWRNMVNAVRSKAPNAQFAFTPFTGNESGADNGYNDMNDWYVSGKDNLGKPYMNYWGFTFYINTQGTNCSYPCIPTAATYEQNLAFKMNPSRRWSIGQQIAFARSKGLKLYNSELGLSLNRSSSKRDMSGDYPEAIDTLRKFVEMTRNDVIAYVWFNGNPDFDSRVDGTSPIGKRVGQRFKEVFPY